MTVHFAHNAPAQVQTALVIGQDDDPIPCNGNPGTIPGTLATSMPVCTICLRASFAIKSILI